MSGIGNAVTESAPSRVLDRMSPFPPDTHAEFLLFLENLLTGKSAATDFDVEVFAHWLTRSHANAERFVQMLQDLRVTTRQLPMTLTFARLARLHMEHSRKSRGDAVPSGNELLDDVWIKGLGQTDPDAGTSDDDDDKRH